MRGILILLAAAACAAQSPEAIAVNFDGVIHPITAYTAKRVFQEAADRKATLVLVRLDTPGGMLEATRQIIERMDASAVPVVTYVPGGGRAASAGFFLLLAGDVAAMAGGTHTGAAAPVLLGGQTMDPVMRKKVENDTAAMIRGLASRHHRASTPAEQAVIDAKSFTDQEALNAKIIDLTVKDEAALLAQLDGREITRPNGDKVTLRTAGIRVSPYEPSLRERVVQTIADPNLSFALVMIGAVLLYLEFTNPGIVIAGVAGSIMVVLGLLAISVLPINAAGVALLALSAALFILEAKIASHGVLGAGGAVAMVLGAMLLVDGPPEMRIRFSTALAVSVPFALITMFLVSLVIKARTRPAAMGLQAMRQETGFAFSDLNPQGTVFIHGEYWNAVAEQPIPRGARVRVAEIDGLRLKVEAAP